MRAWFGFHYSLRFYTVWCMHMKGAIQMNFGAEFPRSFRSKTSSRFLCLFYTPLYYIKISSLCLYSIKRSTIFHTLSGSKTKFSSMGKNKSKFNLSKTPAEKLYLWELPCRSPHNHVSKSYFWIVSLPINERNIGKFFWNAPNCMKSLIVA